MSALKGVVAVAAGSSSVTATTGPVQVLVGRRGEPGVTEAERQTLLTAAEATAGQIAAMEAAAASAEQRVGEALAPVPQLLADTAQTRQHTEAARTAILAAGQYGALPSVATRADLPASPDGELRLVRDEHAVYKRSGGAWSLDTQLARPLERTSWQRAAGEITRAATRTPQTLSVWIFDDGHVTLWGWVKPLFDARGIVGCIPVIGSKINAANYMTAAQLTALHGAGWELMNHTQDHLYMATLATAAEVEAQVTQGRQAILALGIEPRNFVAPYQSQGARERAIIRQFHRSAWISDGKVLTQPIDTFQASRVNFDGNTLAYCKAKVDEAQAAGVPIVWCLHPQYPEYTTDATAAQRRQDLADLLDYIAGKGIPTVTVDALLDRVGNFEDIGDSTGTYYRVGGDGSVIGNALGTLRYGGMNTVTAATQATAFTPGTVSIHKVQTANAAGFPENAGGSLETDRTVTGTGFAWQRYTLAANNRMYFRTQKGDGTWDTWARLSTATHIEGNNARTDATPPSAFPFGTVTINPVLAAAAGNLPGAAGGTLITTRPATGTDFAYQEWRLAGTLAVHVRRGTSADGWTGWTELPTVALKATIIHSNTPTAATLPSGFTEQAITITQKSNAQATSEGLPEGLGGTLLTRRLTGANHSYARQEYQVQGTNRTYIRNGATGDTWLAWTPLSPATSTITVDVGNIPAQSSVDTVLTVAGAAVGQGVSVVPVGAPEGGLSWGAWVSGAGQVTLRLVNATAAAIDPASRQWRVTLST